MQRADFHTHSCASDGALTPAALLQRAHDQGVEVLSITDHDTLAAYRDLPSVPTGLTLIPGVELSTSWRGVGIHVLGLGVDPDSQAMRDAEASQQAARRARAQRIAERLARRGLAVDRLPEDGWIGRPWFAEQLVERGHVTSLRQAYRQHLGAGKPGDVKTTWAHLEQVIGWIREAGGDAVLAHPTRYRLTNTRLRALLDEFQRAGGTGMEVVCGSVNADRVQHLAEQCADRGLLMSWGSDFHRPGARWSEPGRHAPLPPGPRRITERLDQPSPWARISV